MLHCKFRSELFRQWEEKEILNVLFFQEVKLRSFSTAVHKVEAAVSYKADL